MQLRDLGDSIAGKKLIAIGRDVSKVGIISGSSSHRTQRVDIRGKPAKCFIDIPLMAAD